MKLSDVYKKWQQRADRLFAKADAMEEKYANVLMDEGTYQKQCRLYREAATISMILQDLKKVK